MAKSKEEEFICEIEKLLQEYGHIIGHFHIMETLIFVCSYIALKNCKSDKDAAELLKTLVVDCFSKSRKIVKEIQEKETENDE